MRFETKKRAIAFALLFSFSIQLFCPAAVYALTSGPQSPEMTSFQPAGTADMVNLFSGDLNYDIPLLDVGGYPINLSYQGGAHPEEEASWVGFGWTLNPGAITRQLRGIPDDFDGDMLEQWDKKKPNVTVGANLNTTLRFMEKRVKILKKKKKFNGDMKVKIGISHNNYTGYKGMVGIGTAFNTTNDYADDKTQGLQMSTDLSASMGLTSDNQNGINPYANFGLNFKITTEKERQAEKKYDEALREYKANMEHNKKDAKLYCTAELQAAKKRLGKVWKGPAGSGSSVDFLGFQAPPLITTPMVGKNFTASLSIGVTFFGMTGEVGVEGTMSKQELKDQYNKAPAYGFINSHKARSNQEALLDYNIEKETPYIKRLPNLGVTVFSPDMLNVTSNAGSMQFRSYLRGAGIFFKPSKQEKSNATDIGLEPAFGNLFHLAVPLQLNKSKSNSGKWNTKNEFLVGGDFRSTNNSQPGEQAFYFKPVGEKNEQDQQYFNAIGNTSPVAVRLDKSVGALVLGKGTANNKLRVKGASDITNVDASRTRRDKANQSITCLTAEEASNFGLDKKIYSYDEDKYPYESNSRHEIERVSAERQPHHISQYTITGGDGQRMVYGIPVYNKVQYDVSFAVDGNPNHADHVMQYDDGDNTTGNLNGKDWYFNKSKVPAYSTGHLLTGILSPDYVDLTGNGITDDDAGNAIKFNYSLVSTNGVTPNYYKWRTPYSNFHDSQKGYQDNEKTAGFNEGYKSIPDDDRANYSYGEKELWYVHSIESKTMIARFIVEERADGLGVKNEDGFVGKDPGDARLRKLKEIRLYTKAELYAHLSNPDAATPVKVVHFEYYDQPGDPEILNNVPNHEQKKGKLVLKAVWFSYGKNDKGQYHKYQFAYNIPVNTNYLNYSEHTSDRWGSYKHKSANPLGTAPGATAPDNIEYPYAVQNKEKADEFAAYWQLSTITLPSGGIINIQYEADDYAYVQDKRAAQMCYIKGIGTLNGTTEFESSDKLYVQLPEKVKPCELGKRYFQGLKTLAFRTLVDLDGKQHWEYVSGYAGIASYRLVNSSGTAINCSDPATDPESDIAEIQLSMMGSYNPIAKAAWQKLRLELPRFAYPEIDNHNTGDMGFIRAIRALGAAFGRFGDLVESFDKRAVRKGFGDNINLNRSWVRLNTPTGIRPSDYSEPGSKVKGKIGGGHRVRQITMSDNWSNLSGVPNSVNGSYGQRYQYTTKNQDGEIISSGVASYEPLAGGDENPFREPINFSDKPFFNLPRYFYLERPMGETYFPGATVGYSKVTVESIGADDKIGEDGSTVHEFYTAKDFPTKVDELTMDRRQPLISFLPRLFGAKITSAVTVSQGYVVENNDMHGRSKSEAVYGKNGNEVSSVKYFYKVTSQSVNAEKQELDNTVDVAYNDFTYAAKTVGMDIEMFTEMMESELENSGVAVDPSFSFSLPFRPRVRIPLPQPNYEKRLYRGSTTIKLVNRFAILHKVVKTLNGSTNTTENLLWDAETGEVLLSKSHNEFKTPLFSFSYPAHWIYQGMGSAFTNEGVYIKGFSTDPSLGNKGRVQNTYDLLTAGDELIDLGSNRKYWLLSNNSNLWVIDRMGKVQTLTNADIKVLRSGKRNVGIATIGTVITTDDPRRVNGKLAFDKRILTASAVTYTDYWPMPVALQPITANGSPLPVNQCSCYAAVFSHLINSGELFTAGYDVEALLRDAVPGYSFGACPYLEQMHFPGVFYALTSETFGTSYMAQFGVTSVCIQSLDGSPVNFNNLYPQCNATDGQLYFRNGPGGAIVAKMYLNCTVQRCDPVVVNPYLKGILGNWRKKEEKIFDEKRVAVSPNGGNSTDIRKSGFISDFISYWNYDEQTGTWGASSHDNWRSITEVTRFNTAGHEIENKDALDRFSSSQFGYLQTLPVAVAANAKLREVGYNGFEDYYFNLGLPSSPTNTCGIQEHFGFLNGAGNPVVPTDARAHSGRYSVLLNGTITLDKPLLDEDPAVIHDINSDHEFRVTDGYLRHGLIPIPGEKYILSGWVYDGAPRSTDINGLSLTINGGSYDVNAFGSDPSTYSKVNVVEGWKRFQVVFTMPPNATSNFTLHFSGSGIYLDDVRVLPYDAQIKSFAYDHKSMRLMAELDENNFATFYEYDDQGILIRVKKETEKGISTIKESRSSTHRQ